MGIHDLIKRLLQFIVICLILISCNNKTQEKSNSFESLLNTTHLDSLYEEVTISEKTFGIIHIYSEYPDYKWVGDEDEGIACIDDASRAAVLYLNIFEYNGSKSYLDKAKMLLEFIMYMQADNGFFYNFIFDDYSINKNHKNSKNEPDWWSWGAMWALSNGYSHFVNVDKDFAEIIYKRLEEITEELKKIMTTEREIKTVNGKERVCWLPKESASDQASIIILSLLNYYSINKDESILEYINNLCDGILNIQKGDSTKFPYSAFMSWENSWHGYGNLQSYSLLKASSILEREDILLAAISEINYFYKFLMNENYLSSFSIKRKNDEFIQTDAKQFPQIAYNIRVMVYASLEAYNITKDSAYAIKAGEIASWLLGINVASAQMYFPSSGICYDGINSRNDINKNSGAESTIEALMTIIKLNKNLIAMTSLTKIAEQLRKKF